ncbi:hypothetical protein [Sinosporangium siamense]|uniref:Uncharacterized protein n=1 Tax=Sinosporangium siamense TaxID=1367973 RepID=A0A919VBJ8_9ACTN|nr:hypothetical protein [Sinosporangium siamense]GII92194.1 hypothetical protein Ssi02_24250 [Sinosporangium siamense]
MQPEKYERLEADEVQAAFAANRSLGHTFEEQIAEGLVDRINSVIDARLATQKARQAPLDWAQMTLGIVSIVLTIPMLAIVQDEGVLVVFAVLGLIAVVNLAYALTRALHNRRD